MTGMKTKHPAESPQRKRQSVTLTARDLEDLAMIRNSPEARRAVGATESMSEAALLHTLVAHSLRQAREAAAMGAYAALAADPEEIAIEGALRARRRERRERVSAE
ncbi:MAG: hypothetical protein QG671_2809 [Actinomycetota bacterium]|nr:hypothetical protein [Actinomycetota bacterium]